MAYVNPQALVGTEWLAERLGAPNLRVVDATYFLPGAGRDAREEYDRRHIPGAVFFDIDRIRDPENPLPHMLPSASAFAGEVGRLGIGDGARIVAYDTHGLMSAARAWWMFRVFGHQDVAVLDGGLPKWQSEGRPLDDGPVRPVERRFTVRVNGLMARDRAQMLANVAGGREQVLDARSRGRFEGADPEPRPGLRAGHIPGSRNLPFTDLIDPARQTMLPPEELKQRFAEAGLDMTRPVVTTCGSGITAAVLALGLQLVGHRDVGLYDGSWAEWGEPDDTPVETGPAR